VTPYRPGEYHILNLGAGVQSTTLYLMFMRGEITPQIDCAIFADTQEEPAAVYRHLEWLQSLNGPQIIVRTAGKLGDDLMNGTRAPGAARARFAAIPAFVINEDGGIGRLKRQCSKEYKTQVIERTIRRDILGLKPRQRFPRNIKVVQYIGISLDEAGRAGRISKRFSETCKWSTPKFPLIERYWTRPDCLNYLVDKLPHQCPRSACTFCPNRDDTGWLLLRQTDPEGWARAVRLDKSLRNGAVASRKMSGDLFLHRSCLPLDLVQFDPTPKPRELQLSMSFASECEGVCGV
jgi:hypothetical protein